MNSDVIRKKTLSFIGLAIRSGNVCKGDSLCEKAVKTGKAKLVIVAEDASDNTKKKFSDKCAFYEVKYVEFASKEELGRLTGSDVRAVLTINDENFTTKLLEMIL